MKALVGAFNQGKAIVRGLLPDCEIFANLRLAFVTSSSAQSEVWTPAMAVVAVLVVTVCWLLPLVFCWLWTIQANIQ